MGHNNLSGAVSQQFVSYRQEKVLQKFRRVIMFISIPHEVNYLTESDKNIPEPLLRASKKSFAPPQSFHFLFRSLREILLSNRLQLQFRNLFTRKYEIA